MSCLATRTAAIVHVVLLLAIATGWPSSAAAQTDAATARWRFYTVLDGLRESWVESVTCVGLRRCWITHGAVEQMTMFDGYGFEQLPAPGSNIVVREGPDGELWAMLPSKGERFTYGGVQRLEDKSWRPHPIAGLERTPMDADLFLPWAPGRVLIAQTTRALEYDRASGEARLLVDLARTTLQTATMVRAAEGGAWIGGRGAVARLQRSDAGLAQMIEHRLPAELAASPVVRLHDCGREGLFAATAPSDDAPSVLLRLRGSAWEEVDRAAGTDVIEGWSSPDGIWTLTSTGHSFRMRLLRESGPPLEVTRAGVLSGALQHVELMSDGGFLVATSLGLAMHRPGTWRTPASAAHLTGHVGSMTQARDGTIYALYESGLLRYDGVAWTLLPYPDGATANLGITEAIGELTDGRIMLGVVSGLTTYLFNPRTGAFEGVTHPKGRAIEVLGRSPRHVWVHTFSGSQSWLETFDGTRFEERHAAGDRWRGIMPRAVVETADGDVFVLPDRTGIGWLRGTEYKVLGPNEGYKATGAFTASPVGPGRLWFGGRDGILEWEGGRWREVRSDLQTVRSILPARDGTIWVGSGSGVHAFRQDSWLTSTVQEGVPPGAVYDVFQAQDGVIWGATTVGLTRYHPDADAEPPRARIDPTQNAPEVPPSGETRIVFAGRDRWDHSPGARLQYSWRIDGGSWSTFTPVPAVTLRQLSIGRHAFEVRARDRNWNLETQSAGLSFVVLVPWYRELGFLAVLGGGLLALAAAVGLFLTRHFRLERLVHDRTEELALANRQLRMELDDRKRIEEDRGRLETQLHQSQKLEAFGRLSGGLAHDFNNLLTVIGSYSALIQHDLPADHPLQPATQEISNAAERAGLLTRQLLTFSRHQVVSPEVVDPNETVGGIERMLARLIGEDIDLVFRPGATLWRVLVAAGQIEQVIVNLAVNARDAMPRGGQLTIETSNVQLDATFGRLHVDATPGRYVLIAVSDTGVGMDEATRARAFEPFFTTKEQGKGSGLGLSTVYGIVRQAGGHVSVYSEPNVGSSFKIYLPATSQSAEPARGDAGPASAGGDETILLVEDEPAVRQLVANVLRARGYTVLVAEHATAALELWREARDRIALVISDIILSGGISGPELVASLSADRPVVRVLLMSGYADDAVLRNGMLPQNRTYLQKPFTADTLAARVRDILDSEPSTAPQR